MFRKIAETTETTDVTGTETPTEMTDNETTAIDESPLATREGILETMTVTVAIHHGEMSETATVPQTGRTIRLQERMRSDRIMK